MDGFSSATSKGGHAESPWPATGGHEAPAATWFGMPPMQIGGMLQSDVPWAASAWRDNGAAGHEPRDSGTEAISDRMVETCAMWVFMGAMACAIVSLGFLVLPMVVA